MRQLSSLSDHPGWHLHADYEGNNAELGDQKPPRYAHQNLAIFLHAILFGLDHADYEASGICAGVESVGTLL